MATQGNESIRYDVQISAEAAVQELRGLINQVQTVDQKVIVFSENLMRLSQKWGVHWKQLLATFEQINARLSQSKQATIFGPVGGQPVFEMSKQYLESATAAGRYSDAAKGAAQSTKDVDDAMEKGGESAKKFHVGINLVRTALGTLAAMLIFRVIQGVQDFFMQAIKGARELELAMYNVGNAERLLSERGLAVTAKDIQNIVAEVEKLVPTFSHVDVSNAVAGIALFTKDLGLSVQQMEDLSKSIAVLAVRNRAFGLTFEQVRSQVLTGILTGRAQGIRDLGVSISETTIQAEALRLGLVKDEKAFDALSGEMEANVKAQALVSIITKSTAGEMDTLNDYLSTSDAKIEKNKAAWENLATTLGVVVNRAIPDISQGLENLQKKFEIQGLQNLFLEATKEMDKFGISWFKREEIFLKIGRGAKLSAQELEVLRKALASLSQEQILDVFPDLSAIKDEGVKAIISDFVKLKDTATAAGPAVGGLTEELSKMEEALTGEKFQDLLSDLERFNQQMAQMQRDYNQKMERMQADHETDMRRMQEDYERSVASTVQDYNDRMADAESRYRLQELEAEARYQEKLRQLREKFLYNLEDALRQRDARQVLRLIREYQMEKTAAQNEEKIRAESAARQHAEEMARLRREMAERLAQLAEEFRVKQARAEEDYRTKKAIEEQEWEDDKADLAARIQERLDQFIEALAKEYGIDAEGVEKIRELLNQYYGPGGFFDGLYDYSYTSMVTRAQAMLDELKRIYGEMQSTMTPTGGGYTPGDQWWNDLGNQAKGGTYLATSPTKATFGDRGPEVATFIPLNKAKSSATAGLGMSGGVGGSVTVRVQLSKGLEASIVDQSLEGITAVLEQVERSRR